LSKHSQRKRIGTLAENDLLGRFWDHGFAAIRSAGSGSMRHPGPDLLVGKGRRVFAVECKKTKEKVKYLPKEEMDALLSFSRLFGAESYLAVQFGSDDWLLVALEDLDQTGRSYRITKEKATLKGLSVEELARFVVEFDLEPAS